MNRANTNESVLRKANDEMKKYKPSNDEIKLFSELVRPPGLALSLGRGFLVERC